MDIFALMDMGLDSNQPSISLREEELISAASRDSRDELLGLLAEGTSCRAMLNGLCAVHISAKKGKLLALTTLLEFDPGAVNFPAENGRTALLYAAHEGYLEVVRSLHENGADEQALTETGSI